MLRILACALKLNWKIANKFLVFLKKAKPKT